MQQVADQKYISLDFDKCKHVSPSALLLRPQGAQQHPEGTTAKKLDRFNIARFVDPAAGRDGFAERKCTHASWTRAELFLPCKCIHYDA